HIPTLREAAIWSSLYVGVAVLFGLGVWALGGSDMGAEYFAGYVTEKALSVDNLFRSEEHTSELQSRENLVCRLLLEKKKMEFEFLALAKHIYLENYIWYFICNHKI